MERKIVGILVVTLLIATAVLPVVGTMNVGNNQGVGKFVQPCNPPKLSKLPLLPPFLLEMFNGDWNYWSNSPHMFTIPEGNVGIGTSNPTSELEVVGNVEADSFTINGNPIGTSTDSYWSEGEEGNINYGGDVDIDGELSVTGKLKIGQNSLSLAGGPFQGTDQILSDNNKIVLGGDPIVSNIKVGIGMTDINHALNVKGSIFISGEAYDSSLLFGDDTPTADETWGQWGIEYWDQWGGLNFWKPWGSNNFGNNFLFLKDNGDVGIGTADPTAKLDVNGDIKASGTISAAGLDVNGDIKASGTISAAGLPRMMTGRVYNVPKNSFSPVIYISSLGCTEWPAITVYTNSPANPEVWNTYYYGWGAPGNLEIDYWLWDVTKTSFQIYNGFEEPHDFRWVAMGI